MEHKRDSIMPRIDEVLKAEDPTQLYISFEFSPPRTENGEKLLLETQIPEFLQQRPRFINVTWGACGETSETTLSISRTLQEKYPNIPVNMHFTCVGMSRAQVKVALDLARASKIQNILVLRGDAPKGKEFTPEKEGLSSALELIKYIRELYDGHFCISTAAYPEGHPSKRRQNGVLSDADWEMEIKYLKEKVDAGANLIMTQLFFDAGVFIKFVHSCRHAGILVPILPGVLPFTSYQGFQNILKLTKFYVPRKMGEKIELWKDDETFFSDYGVEVVSEIIQTIQNANIGVNHFHFYTLNSKQQTFKVLQKLHLLVE